MTPDLPITVRLDRIDLLRIQQMVEDRRKVPVSRTEKVDSWTTRDGDLIEEFKHVRDYPPDLILPRIVPGQTTEMRGWRCPGCGSTDTSVWGVTTVPESGTFECNDCQAAGEWGIYCQRPVPIHLDEKCDCPVDFDEPTT